MKRSHMPPRRTPIQRTAFVSAGVVAADPKPRKRLSDRKSATKAASDAALTAVRPLLLARANGLCEITGQPLVEHPHVHHRRKRGGPLFDVASNLLVVNPNSHLAVFAGSIHAEPMQSRHFGWIVRPGRDWRTVPVLIRGRWQLLDDLGGYVPTVNPHLERSNPA